MQVDFRGIDWLSFFREYGLVKRAKRQRRNKKGQELVNVFSAFDIETSTVWLSNENTDAHAFMYVWQFQIEDYLIKGRTWDEWFDLLGVLRKALCDLGDELKLPENPMMVCWIHNASFEFAFISGCLKHLNFDALTFKRIFPLLP